jgi:hypothetical protein
VSDTPPVTHPPSRLDVAKAFIGDLARPFAIYATSLSASIAAVIIAGKVENGNDGAIALGAIGGIVLGIYTAKAWEMVKTAMTNTPPAG